jgi:hypothetical protein
MGDNGNYHGFARMLCIGIYNFDKAQVRIEMNQFLKK